MLVHICTIILSSASVRKITIPAKRRERFVHAPERGKKDGKCKRSRGRYEWSKASGRDRRHLGV